MSGCGCLREEETGTFRAGRSASPLVCPSCARRASKSASSSAGAGWELWAADDPVAADALPDDAPSRAANRLSSESSAPANALAASWRTDARGLGCAGVGEERSFCASAARGFPAGWYAVDAREGAAGGAPAPMSSDSSSWSSRSSSLAACGAGGCECGAIGARDRRAEGLPAPGGVGAGPEGGSLRLSSRASNDVVAPAGIGAPPGTILFPGGLRERRLDTGPTKRAQELTLT
jgi:hypothetical protein